MVDLTCLRFHSIRLRERPNLVLILVAISTVTVLFLNLVGLIFGITNVLPHLLYIPIILTAYYFPRRGILFAAVLSAAYCALVFGIVGSAGELIAAVERGLVFLLISGVVSYLSFELQQEAERLQRLASVVRSTSDAVIAMTLDTIITEWNRGAEQVYGYTAEEVIGKPVTHSPSPKSTGRVLNCS